ncbi:MAG TPA: D-xylose ABC transporter substrate-binding protein [Actinomycetota bacterium]|nr:D-xylose ABC transporter substrate-binding protein [Actinomycetota bacterium]
MRKRRVWALLGLFVLVLAACGGDEDGGGTTGTTGTTGGGEGLKVGVSWNNYNEERWAKWDEPAIVEALDAAGVEYISTDAGSSAEQQLADVENLISQGANALIILAQDGEAIRPAVASALEQGIPVIAYDRLIEDPGALYITFDNVEVGRLQAQAVYDQVPKGNYVFIKGNSADANADFVHSGQLEVLQDAIDAGDIKNVGESYTDNWDPAVAQTNMEQFLTENNNDVQAVVASNDGMAGGVVAALEAQGLAGEVAVSGQDGDLAALNRVALGTQTVSVWKDARLLGQAAGEAAVLLAQGTALAEIPDTVSFDSPGGNQMTSIFLTPEAITKDNLNVVVDAGWISTDELCQGVEAGTVEVCG